jgi:hypothetical protein
MAAASVETKLRDEEIVAIESFISERLNIMKPNQEFSEYEAHCTATAILVS